MSKKTFFLMALCAAIAAVILVVAVLFGDSNTTETIAAFAAMIGVPSSSGATAYGSDKNSPHLNREDISSTVLQMMPSRTPLDTIMRKLKQRQKADSQKIGYYQASYKPVVDAIDSVVSGTGVSAASPASSYTYNSSSPNEKTKLFIQIKNPDIWRTHDTMLIRNLTLPGAKGEAIIGGTGTHKDDVMFFVASKNESVLELIPVGGVKGIASGSNAGKYVMPDLSSSAPLIRMGQAKSELAITTEPFSIYPSLSWQYCQNFMAQIEESTFQRITKKEANWGFSNYEAVNITSMKMEMELSMLFGQGGEYMSGNDHTYFTRGITRDIQKTLNYGTGATDRTVSKDQYNGWMKEVFDGNNGSTNRVLFAGSGLIKSLSCVDEFHKNLGDVYHNATLGLDVRKIQTYFGTLDIIIAPLLREAGWEDNGIILDLENVIKHEFVPMSVTKLDLKSSGQKNADARVIQEVSCLSLRYPDCHAIIKPKL